MTDTEPRPCVYDMPDTAAAVGTNDDSSWWSRCNCLVMTCVSGTYEEAVNALDAHRAEFEGSA